MITETENQNYVQYVQYVQICKYLQKKFRRGSEVLRKIRIREYVQNRIVLLYEGQT